MLKTEVRSKMFMEDEANPNGPPIANDVCGRRFMRYVLKPDDVREDMHWVYMKDGIPTHTDNLTLPKAGEQSVDAAAIGNDLKERKIGSTVIDTIEEDLRLGLSEDALIARFKTLARKTANDVTGMEGNNLAMIEAFAKKRLDDNPAEDSPLQLDFSTLGEKVFASPKGREFIKAVEKAFAKRIGDIVASNGDIHDWEPVDDNTIARPEFSGLRDNLNRLKFAVHRVYQYDVYVNRLRDCGNGTYEADMEYILYDHFGLDYNDIATFGTKEKVVESNEWLELAYKLKPDITLPILAALGGAGLIATIPLTVKAVKSKTKDDRDRALGIGISSAVVLGLSALGMWFNGVVNAVAPGFRAWFILQHYHPGYRPFVTEMRHKKTYRFRVRVR